MKITKKKLRRIIREVLIRESPEEIPWWEKPGHTKQSWEEGLIDWEKYLDNLLQRYPQLSDTIGIPELTDLHRWAKKETLRVAKDLAALAALGIDRKPKRPQDWADLELKLMARRAGATV